MSATLSTSRALPGAGMGGGRGGRGFIRPGARDGLDPGMDRLIRLVCRSSRAQDGAAVRERDLIGASRRASLVEARGVIAYLAHTELDRRVTWIGRRLGDRHHATVRHAIDETSRRMNDSPVFDAYVSGLVPEVARIRVTDVRRAARANGCLSEACPVCGRRMGEETEATEGGRTA